MGHIEGERCPFFKGIIRVGNPKQKMAKKNSWSKSRQAVLFLALVLFHYYERESWRDERLREGYARADTHTHTHTQRERVCDRAFCESDKREREREREIDAFFFLLCDGRTYPNEREEGGIEKDDVAASFRVVFDDFDFGWFVQR